MVLRRDVRAQAEVFLDRAHPLDDMVYFFRVARNVFYGGFQCIEPLSDFFDFVSDVDEAFAHFGPQAGEPILHLGSELRAERFHILLSPFLRGLRPGFR